MQTLASYLEQNGLTASDFARKLGAAPSTVTRWLKNERAPDVDTMKRIYALTDGAVEPNDFCGIDSGRPDAAAPDSDTPEAAA